MKSAKGKAPRGKRNAPRKVRDQATPNVVEVGQIVKDLRRINPEIRYKDCFETEQFSSGLIAFRPQAISSAKQITHRDKDVVCHVIRGRGRLRLKRRSIELRPGMICHIPKRTPHDFAAGKSGELVLFYSLIKTV